MSYTNQKTLTATVADGTEVRAGLIDLSLQAYPQREELPPAGRRDQLTTRYEPITDRTIAPNVDDDVNVGFEIEPWSE